MTTPERSGLERVGVLVHPTRPVGEAVEIIRRFTEERGLELVQIASGRQPSVAPPGEVSACDLITAVGGDGTVLKALHAAAKTGTPVLGVARGSLGALTSVPEPELRPALERFAANDWSPITLPSLELRCEDGAVASAINDLVFARRGGLQLMLSLSVDDELYVRMAGDGVVVATTTGSSAYSMAAGGPLLASGTGALVCTPLAMHGGSASPLVVPDDREVRLEVQPGHGGFGVEVDGFQLETSALRFALRCDGTYTTLVGFRDSTATLTRLRERGLISDSPRVIAQAGQRSA